jgi:acetylcholinesterase
MFQAPRRFWSQMISAPSYAYLFTERLLGTDPALGTFHSSEMLYFENLTKEYGTVGTRTSKSWLSHVMLDYWISFAVSLTPNDGKGTKSMF